MFKALTRLTMLVCIAALALAACDADGTAEPAADSIAPTVATEPAADSIAPAVVAEPDQVVALYNGQERYVSAARDNPDAELWALYAEHVIDPYWEPCFAGVPEGERAEFARLLSLGDIDRLSASVAMLRAGAGVEIVATALAEARGVIDTPPAVFCVMAMYPTTRSAQLLNTAGGVMTVSWEQAEGVAINPEIDGWQDLLSYTIARDRYLLLQESCCWGPDQAPTLLEAVVSIGKAHSFAEMLFPAASSRQTNVLSPQQEATQWEQMSPDLTSLDPTLIQNYLFIGRVSWGIIPRWTGHTIGYHIVQAYLDAHPKASVEDWTMLDAATLLADSGYTGQP